MGVVVGPSRAVAQAPVGLAQACVGHGSRQAAVEGAQIAVRRLVGAASEELGDVRSPALELTVVIGARALQRGHRDGGRPRLGRPEGYGRAWLVLVLDEPDQTRPAARSTG
jgi:hypothetical protein